MNRVSARLTKRTRWRKASIATTFLPFALAAATAPSHAANANALRDCIAGADNSAAIGACESQQQARLKTRIERLSAAIRTHLDGRQRLVFDRSSDAWQAFIEQEQAMLKLSLGLRRDGLGPALQPGAITRLYEQREQQLREHLHNLSSTQPADSGH